MEYASSPVEQPGIHARTRLPSGLVLEHLAQGLLQGGKRLRIPEERGDV